MATTLFCSSNKFLKYVMSVLILGFYIFFIKISIYTCVCFFRHIPQKKIFLEFVAMIPDKLRAF